MLWLGLPAMAWVFLVLFVGLSFWIFKDYRSGIARPLGVRGIRMNVSRAKDAPYYWQSMAFNSLWPVLCLVLAVILALPKTFPQWNGYLAGEKAHRLAPDDGPAAPRPN